ncbi:M23 family metallopeptidase [Desulfonatronum lacustre]|uniref:M23 family metallopeptidase n=1 Tax=Desulfonatronum lacustre TaxID=66849 RepID=UPI0004AE7972|nr:M23 family metallopeptidase [Desulfonatronum lacustre]
MRRYGIKRLGAGWVVALGMLLFALAAVTAHAQGHVHTQVHIQAPDRVGVGMPFLVRFSGPEDFQSVSLRWLDNDLGLVATKGEQGREAAVLLGVDLETPPGTYRLTGTVSTAEGQHVFAHDVLVHVREFPEQRLRVSREMVSPDASLMPRIEQERRAARAALERVTPMRYWEQPFVRPVQGSVSSAFGLRRFFNDQPRAPHRGVDLRGAEGTSVRAFSNGEVVLAGDHYFAGRSIYIDHGLGVVTQYIHLSEILVQEGDRVVAGQVIGKVGATGRVTGPHLHFGLSVLGMWVDPLPLLE